MHKNAIAIIQIHLYADSSYQSSIASVAIQAFLEMLPQVFYIYLVQEFALNLLIILIENWHGFVTP